MAPPSVFKSYNSVIKLYLIGCVAHLAQFDFELELKFRLVLTYSQSQSLDLETNVFTGKTYLVM